MHPCVLVAALFCLAALYNVQADSEEKRKAVVDQTPVPDQSPMRAQVIEKNDERARRNRAETPVKTDGGSEESAFCVDLTWGWRNRPDTSLFSYRRSKGASRCREQGIIDIRKPVWGRSLSIHMEFKRPSKYTFDLGDNIYSDGWGGGFGYSNAEIFSYGSRVRAYQNRGGNSAKFFDRKLAKKVLYIRLYRHEFYITDYSGFSKWVWPGAFNRFFNYGPNSMFFLGLNRVVRIDSVFAFRRAGKGLCNTCMWWN